MPWNSVRHVCQHYRPSRLKAWKSWCEGKLLMQTDFPSHHWEQVGSGGGSPCQGSRSAVALRVMMGYNSVKILECQFSQVYRDSVAVSEVLGVLAVGGYGRLGQWGCRRRRFSVQMGIVLLSLKCWVCRQRGVRQAGSHGAAGRIQATQDRDILWQNACG